MALSKSKFDKYLKIENNVVYTKRPARIILDLDEYKDISQEFNTEEKAIAEVANNIYEIPGFFTLEFPEDADSIQFYFPYNIYLFETENSDINSYKIEINYEEGDAVFYAKFKKEETNIKILDKLFENGVKYLSNRIDLLIYNIWKQVLPTMNVPWHNFEVIVSQLYITQENGKWIPVRLSKDQRYCKECAVNTKQSAHLLNKTLGFLYGYSNDALLTAITKNDQEQKSTSFMEKLIEGNL